MKLRCQLASLGSPRVLPLLAVASCGAPSTSTVKMADLCNQEDLMCDLELGHNSELMLQVPIIALRYLLFVLLFLLE